MPKKKISLEDGPKSPSPPKARAGKRGRRSFCTTQITLLALVVIIVALSLYVLKQQREFLQELEEARSGEYAKEMYYKQFQANEKHRQRLITQYYPPDKHDRLASGELWQTYSQPFSKRRMCTSLCKQEGVCEPLPDIHVKSLSTVQQKQFLSELVFHSAGIEGNTLSLEETTIVIDGQRLFPGFPDDHVTPSMERSIKEVQALSTVINALKLDQIPLGRKNLILSKKLIQSLHSQGMFNLNVSSTWRRHSVAVGLSKTLLPLPQELESLMNKFIFWANSQMNDMSTPSKAHQVACDVHTMFVFLHPFEDGNGRLARILSGIVLQSFGLPPPSFLKEERRIYMDAVGRALQPLGELEPQEDFDPSIVCKMHHSAVARSIRRLNELGR